MARPKGIPTSIYTLRHETALIARLRKRHKGKLHEYLKNEMTKIDKAKRIPCTDQD